MVSKLMESNFLYTETIKLYCIVLHCIVFQTEPQQSVQSVQCHVNHKI